MVGKGDNIGEGKAPLVIPLQAKQWGPSGGEFLPACHFTPGEVHFTRLPAHIWGEGKGPPPHLFYCTR